MKKNEKSTLLWSTIILLVIIICLVSYILVEWKNNHRSGEPAQNVTENDEESDTYDSDIDEDDEGFKLYIYDDEVQKTVNGKNLTIKFKYYVKYHISGYYDLYYDLYINDVCKKQDIFITNFDDEERTLSDEFDDIIDNMKNSFGIIKTDKEYLYLKSINVHYLFDSGEGVTLDLINDSGDIIYSTTLTETWLDIVDATNCNYERYKGKSELYEGGDSTYYIASDTIYVLRLENPCTEDDYVQEYKIIISDDKVKEEVVTTCDGTGAGHC